MVDGPGAFFGVAVAGKLNERSCPSKTGSMVRRCGSHRGSARNVPVTLTACVNHGGRGWGGKSLALRWSTKPSGCRRFCCPIKRSDVRRPCPASEPRSGEIIEAGASAPAMPVSRTSSSSLLGSEPPTGATSVGGRLRRAIRCLPVQKLGAWWSAPDFFLTPSAAVRCAVDRGRFALGRIPSTKGARLSTVSPRNLNKTAVASRLTVSKKTA